MGRNQLLFDAFRSRERVMAAAADEMRAVLRRRRRMCRTFANDLWQRRIRVGMRARVAGRRRGLRRPTDRPTRRRRARRRTVTDILHDPDAGRNNIVADRTG